MLIHFHFPAIINEIILYVKIFQWIMDPLATKTMLAM